MHGAAEVAPVVAVGKGEPVADRPGGAGPQVGVEGAGLDQNPGVEQVVRIEDRLDLAEQVEGGRRVHQRQ